MVLYAMLPKTICICHLLPFVFAVWFGKMNTSYFSSVGERLSVFVSVSESETFAYIPLLLFASPFREIFVVVVKKN